MKTSKMLVPEFFSNVRHLIAKANSGKEVRIILNIDGEVDDYITPNDLFFRLFNWLDINNAGPKAQYKTRNINGYDLPVEINTFFVRYDYTVKKHVYKISYEWEE